MHALVLLCINQYTKLKCSEVPSFTNYKDMIGEILKKTCHVTEHAPLGVVVTICQDLIYSLSACKI